MPIQFYANGNKVREWLYEDCHLEAILLADTSGRLGETCSNGGADNRGSRNERNNCRVVEINCAQMGRFQPQKSTLDPTDHLHKRWAGHVRHYANKR